MSIVERYNCDKCKIDVKEESGVYEISRNGTWNDIHLCYTCLNDFLKDQEQILEDWLKEEVLQGVWK